MKPLLILALLGFTLHVCAQKQSFDLATFIPPKGWKKQVTANGIQFTKEDAAKGTYGSITLLKAVPGTADSKENFDLAWTSLVKEMVTVSEKPEMQAPATEDGWEVVSGHSTFEQDGNKGIVILATSTGFGKMMNLIILTNTNLYEKDISSFIESITLKKPETTMQQAPVDNTNNNTQSITGTWGKNAGASMAYGDAVAAGMAGYTKDQYTFNDNGTYRFISKTFRMNYDKLILVKENGTYQISGTNTITISPQKSVIETWSKKDGADKWGKLLSSKNRSLERVAYKFTKHYFSGIQLWNLVLQSNQPTQRDGAFGSNPSFTNAYYYSPISSNNPVIVLPGEQQTAQQTRNEPPVPAVSNGYTFTTTNFDDGWTGTAQEDWVLVTKGVIRVLIHYPDKKIDRYSMDLLEGLKNAWNVLVAPRYSNMSAVEFRPLHNWEPIEFAEADAVEIATGKPVHIVLYKKNYSDGGGKYLEFITPDKKSFVQEFGVFEAALSWEKVEKMGNYNKFAVAAADLKGKWTNNYSGFTQYVNAYTGADAGMNTHASNQNYYFGTGSTYKWDLGVASGMVGNIKFQSVKSAGKFSMIGNWQIHFSDMEGKPKTYNVSFSCIKGFRILWIDGQAFGRVE